MSRYQTINGAGDVRNISAISDQTVVVDIGSTDNAVEIAKDNLHSHVSRIPRFIGRKRAGKIIKTPPGAQRESERQFGVKMG